MPNDGIPLATLPLSQGPKKGKPHLLRKEPFKLKLVYILVLASK